MRILEVRHPNPSATLNCNQLTNWSNFLSLCDAFMYVRPIDTLFDEELELIQERVTN